MFSKVRLQSYRIDRNYVYKDQSNTIESEEIWLFDPEFQGRGQFRGKFLHRSAAHQGVEFWRTLYRRQIEEKIRMTCYT